jgi:hypothetical protein
MNPSKLALGIRIETQHSPSRFELVAASTPADTIADESRIGGTPPAFIFLSLD